MADTDSPQGNFTEEYIWGYIQEYIQEYIREYTLLQCDVSYGLGPPWHIADSSCGVSSGGWGHLLGWDRAWIIKIDISIRKLRVLHFIDQAFKPKKIETIASTTELLHWKHIMRTFYFFFYWNITLGFFWIKEIYIKLTFKCTPWVFENVIARLLKILKSQ